MKKLGLLLIIVLLLSACAPAPAAVEEEGMKIISLAPSLTEIIYALGQGDNLVGRSDYDNYPAEVLDVESIGSIMEPDIEKIVSLQPDLVVHVFDNPDLYAKLEEAGIKVMQFEQADSIDETYALIERFGTELKQEEKAQEIVKTMKEKIEAVKQSVAQADPVSVYYVVGFGPDGDFTATGDTFIHEMLTVAGGDNVAKDATGWSYNLESLISADPEIIVLSDQWDMKTNFLAADGYQQLSAAKADKVFEINPDLLERQGPRIADGIEALAKMLHPELVK